jgi:tetratricopeptide (TPR) repeat protein
LLLPIALSSAAPALADEVLQTHDPATLITDGVAAQDAGQFNRAETLFRQASVAPDTQEQGVLLLAKLLMKQARYDDAKGELKGFVNTNPFSADAHLLLIDLYLAQENVTDADAEIKIVARLRPNYEPFQERRAILAFRAGQYDKAIESLTRVLATQPNHVNALSLRSQAYMNVKNYHGAVKDLEQLTQLQPTVAENYRALAGAYAMLDDFDRALWIVKHGLEATRTLPQEKGKMTLVAAGTFCDLAEVYLKRHELNKAREILKSAMHLHVIVPKERGQIFWEAGKVLEAMQIQDEAAHYYQKAYLADPTRTDAAIRMGTLLMARGSSEEASGILRQVLQHDPGNEEAAHLLVRSYTVTKRMDALGKFLLDYVDAYPSRIWALTEYVHLLSRVGSLGTANPALARAVRESSKSVDHYLLYAKVLFREKRTNEAAVLLEHAVSLFPGDSRVRFDLGLCDELQGKFVDAKKQYLAVKSKDEEVYFQARVNLALLQEREGDLDTSKRTLTDLRATIGESEELRNKLDRLAEQIGTKSRRPASTGASQ